MIKAALIGEGIQASLTPEMHMAEGAAQGLSYRYDRIDTRFAPWRDMPLPALISHAQEQGFAGVNITHPFKIAACALVDDLSPTARDLGAINTIVFQNGGRVGHNTDYIGFRSSLRVGLHHSRLGRVLQIGAGGAGSAVALGLIDQGVAHLTLLDQDEARAVALAETLRALRTGANVTPCARVGAREIAAFDGVVNATPMGMAAHPGIPIDPANLNAQAWVVDIIYFPRETALIQRAKARNLRTQTGADMAVFQAVAAFNLITGVQADPARMQAHFQALSNPQETSA